MAIIMHNDSHRIGSSYVAPVAKPHPYADYLARFNPMRRAKVQAAMDRAMRLDGVVMSRWDAINKIFNEGARIDRVKGRVYHGGDSTFYDVSGLTATAVDYLEYLLTL